MIIGKPSVNFQCYADAVSSGDDEENKTSTIAKSMNVAMAMKQTDINIKPVFAPSKSTVTADKSTATLEQYTMESKIKKVTV